jgi:sialate O-acetylesterase
MYQRAPVLGFALTALACLQAQAARADVKPNGLIADGMVLQRDMKVPLWGTADEGEKVTVKFQDQEVSAAAKDGKWEVQLDKLKAGGPFEMTIAGKNTLQLKNVLVGEVWIASGQSNMEMSVAGAANAKAAIEQSANPMIHLFTVPKKPAAEPQTDVQGKWEECGPDTVRGFSAVAYFFGKDLQKALGVPVGLIHTSWGGTVAEAWTSHGMLEAHPELKGLAKKYDQAAAAKNPNGSSVLFNGMIAPLVPYAIRGAIWYQGESNAGRAYQYRTLFPAMIRDWRHHWHEGPFPFLFVQLAPFQKIEKQPQESAWAELREAQLLTAMHIPETAMAVITDLGDEKDIHPNRKAPVGGRLALAALALAHHRKIEYSGPVYDGMKVEGDKVELSFKHVGSGLEAKGGRLEGFTIAGKDRKFVNAEAEARGDKVIVWSPQVREPVAVRYGWANYPVVNLYNKQGLPASPFRTDDFPILTGPK